MNDDFISFHGGKNSVIIIKNHSKRWVYNIAISFPVPIPLTIIKYYRTLGEIIRRKTAQYYFPSNRIEVITLISECGRFEITFIHPHVSMWDYVVCRGAQNRNVDFSNKICMKKERFIRQLRPQRIEKENIFIGKMA